MIRECRDEVLLGIIRFWSVWSRVPGRPSRSPVRGRTKEEWLLSDGPMMSESNELILDEMSVMLNRKPLYDFECRNMPDIVGEIVEAQHKSIDSARYDLSVIQAEKG